MSIAESNQKERSRVTIFAARKWWGLLVENFLLISVGLSLILFLTSIDFLGLMLLLALSLLIGGACLLVMGIRWKEKGMIKRIIVLEGALGVLTFLAYYAVNVLVSDNSTERTILAGLMVVWAVVSAIFVLLSWRARSAKADQFERKLQVTSMASSLIAYLAFALALVLISPDEMLKDYYSGWRTNIIIVSVLLATIGLARLLMAFELMDTTTLSKWYGRRWAVGATALTVGSFLTLVGVFAFFYKDLVWIDDPGLGLNYQTLGYVYRDEATGLLVVGVILLAVGAILLATGWRQRSSKVRPRVIAVIVAAILIIQVIAAMLVVNPAALDTSSNRWDMHPGDFLTYSRSNRWVTQTMMNSGGPLFTNSIWFNFTISSTVLEVVGRSEIYLSSSWESEGSQGGSSVYTMPKDAQTIEVNEAWPGLAFLRDEMVVTPWGPRLCQRYSGEGYIDGQTYSRDKWMLDGIVLVDITDIQGFDSYDEQRTWSFIHQVFMMTATSLEEVTGGPSAPVQINTGAWSPEAGQYFNYTRTSDYGQSSSWDYLVKEANASEVLLNLTVNSAEDPSNVISSSDQRYPIADNTAMGVAMYPSSSEGSFYILPVGNETLDTRWGELECTHFFVVHIMEDIPTYVREDLWARNGVLLRVDGAGEDMYSMTLENTNMAIV